MSVGLVWSLATLLEGVHDCNHNAQDERQRDDPQHPACCEANQTETLGAPESTEQQTPDILQKTPFFSDSEPFLK